MVPDHEIGVPVCNRAKPFLSRVTCELLDRRELDVRHEASRTRGYEYK